VFRNKLILGFLSVCLVFLLTAEDTFYTSCDLDERKIERSEKELEQLSESKDCLKFPHSFVPDYLTSQPYEFISEPSLTALSDKSSTPIAVTNSRGLLIQYCCLKLAS
jgi:hypothetical protein